MAQWIPIVEVGITLNTAGSTREGFGLPIFIAATDAFPERVRGYASIDDVAEDFPDENSAVYKAALKLWSQTPRVTQLYVGRRNLQYILNISATPNAGDTYSITLKSSNNLSTTFSYTAIASDEAEQVFTAIKTQIEADAAFASIAQATLSGTGAGAALMIDPQDPDKDFIQVPASGVTSSLITVSTTSSDSPAVALKRIEEYNDEFYFVGCDSRVLAEVEALAKEIQARKKIFFTASAADAALIGTDITSATDLPAYLANNKFSRTVCLWHHEAATDYPEMAYIAYGAPYDAGSISWGNALLTGVDYSRQPANLRPLNTSQKAALESRNCNYIDYEGGQNVVRHGKVASGEWIDIIRGVDWLESELRGDLRDLLINQKGGKITYDDTGITRVKQVIETALQRAVNRRFLESFTVTVPRALDVSVADKRARLLKDVKFTGILAGAINDINLQGSVSYE